MIKIQIKNISNNHLPTYEVKGSAGMDLRADFSRVNNLKDITAYGDVGFRRDKKTGKKSVELYPVSRILIPTGVHIALPEGYEAQVRPRSGLALKHGIMVVNSPGTVDPFYLDEVGVLLMNCGSSGFTINEGDRIGQMVISKFETVEWEEVEELAGFNRGGGFGHTGKE